MVKITFSNFLTKTDPQKTPVLIVGKLANLLRIKFDDVSCKLEPRVNEETFKTAVYSLHPSPTDTCSLYLNWATLAALPTKCSRHNTPSRSHAITRLVQNCSVGVNESIVIVCERNDVFASGCAVARAYPLYSRKTPTVNNENVNVSVEFLVLPPNETREIDGVGCELTEEDFKALDYAATGIRLSARIVDTPCNEMNVDNFLEEIKSVGRELNITPTVIRGEELAKKGLGGIYGVGKAAIVPPALAVLSYTPPDATSTIAWVGKGIVYDTGGLSIKAKTTMPGMKRDCGGAAAVLGAFQALVKANFTQNLHAVFCLAENAVGPIATRPDDIHTLYSGRTVEINNTDAEGRLVLADGVVYANRDLKANVIVDLATLTAAQAIATGKFHGAILSNNGNWEDLCMQAGLTSGDLVFPIPYCPELQFSEFASAVADMKNSVADRNNAQSSCAAIFVGAHLGFDYPGIWVHVDMASPVHVGERATGYGVALLCTLFGSYCKQSLLSAIAPDLESKNNEGNAKKVRIN